MKLFEIVVAGQRFAMAREPGGANQFYQTYYVDGRDVPVQHYLKMIAMAMGIDGDSVGQGPPRVARDVRGREASRTTSD
jgi:protein-disulfide isomerase-like protein with CxxC motif